MIACDCSPTVIPLALRSILLHFIMRAQEGSVTTSHLHFDLHTRPCSHTQRDKVGSQLTCRHTKKANFCLAVTGNSSLGSRSRVGGGVGEKILHCMGMGLKENTAQTPDVETPCTHTSTHTNKCKHTQWHTYTKTNRWGKEAVMRVINKLLELHLASSDWLLELISWVCWQSLKWANTRCQDEQMRRCVCPWVSTRANETR